MVVVDRIFSGLLTSFSATKPKRDCHSQAKAEESRLKSRPIAFAQGDSLWDVGSRMRYSQVLSRDAEFPIS
jgi:hypothetical protein